MCGNSNFFVIGREMTGNIPACVCIVCGRCKNHTTDRERKLKKKQRHKKANSTIQGTFEEKLPNTTVV